MVMIVFFFLYLFILTPITPLHTSGSFTFMVIQIMKLSIQEILR